MPKLRGGINANVNKNFEIPKHLLFNLPEPEQEEEEEEEKVEEPIIEKPKSINAKIKDLFYDPRIGLLSLDKFYKKVQKIIPEATFKDVQKFYNKQNINQVFERTLRPKVYNSMYAWYCNNIVEIDFIVYNRYSIHHYEYIFCYIDVYSRFAQAIGTTNMLTTTIIKCLETIFKTMGKPQIIKGDNQFNTPVFIAFCQKNNIGCEFTSSNEIYKNPIVERFNGTLARNINKFRTLFKRYDWYKYLPDVVFNYNNTYHKTIKNTPNDIFFNNEMNNQKVIILPKVFDVGEKVRKVIKKKIFEKGDMTTHSQEVYIITDAKGKKYKINDGTDRWYKPYELKMANEVEFHDDYNPNIPTPQPKPRKKTDVQKELILEPREIRPKKTINYKALNSKGN
jgi:hypothetical protein